MALTLTDLNAKAHRNILSFAYVGASSTGGGSYIGAGQFSSSSNKKKGNFTKKLLLLAILIIVIIIIGIISLFASDPLTKIRADLTWESNEIPYDTNVADLGLVVEARYLSSGWKKVPLSSVSLDGYDSKKLGSQTIEIQYEGKTTTKRIKIVPAELSTPSLTVKEGVIVVDYNADNTEQIIVTINGVEYTYNTDKYYKNNNRSDGDLLVTKKTIKNGQAVNGKSYYSCIMLPQDLASGEYSLQAKAISSDENVIASGVSDAITVEKYAPVRITKLDDSKIYFEKSSSGNLYGIYVDGELCATTSDDYFDLLGVNKAGSHQVSVAVHADDDLHVNSSLSESYGYNVLAAYADFSVSDGVLTWNKIDGALGYELYSNNKLVATLAPEETQYNIMRLYSSTGKAQIAIKAIGDGKNQLTSPLSNTYTHTFTQTFTEVRNIGDLQKLSNSDGAYILVNDIDLMGREWTPIEGFSGTLIGNGFSIKNLTITKAANNLGLFGVLKGTVSDLKLENVNISITTKYENIGALCGKYDGKGTLSNISATGTITATRSNYVGGIVGIAYFGNEVALSNLESGINTTGTECVGGVFGYIGKGYANVQIDSFANNGKVIGTGDYVGGVIGGVCTGRCVYISDSQNTGNVEGTNYVGGIVGYADGYNGSYISGCSSSSAVAGKKYVGAISGRTYNILIENVSNDDSTVRGNDYVGGIAGSVYFGSDTNLTGLENDTDVSGTTYIGGIFGCIEKGYANVQIDSFVNSGKIHGTGDYVGGIAGSINTGRHVYISDSKNAGTVKGTNYVGGISGYADGYSGSYASGCVASSSVEGNNYVGTIFGRAYNIFIENISNEKSTVRGNDYVGGIAGCIYFGNETNLFGLENQVDVTGARYVGGIFGLVDKGYANVQMDSFTNSGKITGNSDYIGGIVGSINTGRYVYFSDCKNYSSVKGGKYVGGIAGYAYGYDGSYITGCSSTGKVSGKSDYGTLTGWDNFK